MKIYALGGYEAVGKNMTCIEVGDEAVIIDMGLFLPAVVGYQGAETLEKKSAKAMQQMGAIPNDDLINNIKSKIIAIVISHCHLDHVAAVPYLASKYKCPIYGSDYTIGFLNSVLKDQNKHLPNKIQSLKLNKTKKLSKNITLELVNTPHSTLQAALVALHTPEGVLLYTNDFKTDDTPILMEPTNYKRLKELKKEGVKAFIGDSLYAHNDDHTPSESYARELLEHTMLDLTNKKGAIFVTSFSSHIARSKSIFEISKKLNRKVYVFGRSMAKYLGVAESLGLINLDENIEICTYRSQLRKAFRQVKQNPSSYVVLCTGGQGEPGSILDRIVNKELEFKFNSKDNLIFSCTTIPVQENIENRAFLEKKLNLTGVNMFFDVHVSGHASAKDLIDMIELIKPEHILPSHCTPDKSEAMVKIAEKLGYKENKTVHILKDGDILEV